MGEPDRGRVISPEETVKQLDERCAFYMSIGMSYADYWEGENCLPNFYLRAYNERKRREMEDQNFAAWLNGLYAANAFGTVLSNAFAKNGSPRNEYPEKPFEIFPHEKTAAEQEAEREEALKRIERSLSAMTAASKQIFGKEK